jgi:hypothetical protein
LVTAISDHTVVNDAAVANEFTVSDAVTSAPTLESNSFTGAIMNPVTLGVSTASELNSPDATTAVSPAACSAIVPSRVTEASMSVRTNFSPPDEADPNSLITALGVMDKFMIQDTVR